MPGSRRSGPTLGLVLVLIGLALAQVLWIYRGSLSEGLPMVAFFLGAGGMMVTFLRWRTQGDAFAKIWCLTAFGTWVLAVAVGSNGKDLTTSHPAYWIAALALLIGLAGGVTTLLRVYLERRQTQGPGERDSSTPT